MARHLIAVSLIGALFLLGWHGAPSSKPRRPPPAPLTGWILEEGRPLAGARVTAPHGAWGGESRSAITGADGRFRLEGIEPGDEWIFVEAEGRFPHEEAVTVQPGPTETEIELHLSARPLVRGTVMDLERRTPVAGATILCTHPRAGNSSELPRLAVTGEDGRFELRGVPLEDPGAWGLEVRKEGYVGTRLKPHRTSLRFDPEALELGLLESCAIEGEVRDDRGVPIEGAFVLVAMAHGFEAESPAGRPFLPSGVELGESRQPVTTSGADGRYRLEGLLPWIEEDAHVILHVPVMGEDEGAFVGLSRPMPSFELPGDVRRQDWSVPSRTGALQGTVTVAGLPVDAELAWVNGICFGRTTAKQGRFRFPRVVAGEVRLCYRLGEGHEERVETVLVAADEEQRVDLRPTLDLSRIRGRLAVAERAPETLRVLARRRDDGAPVSAAVAEDGAFTLELPDAQWVRWELSLDDPSVMVLWGGWAAAGATDVHLAAIPRPERN